LLLSGELDFSIGILNLLLFSALLPETLYERSRDSIISQFPVAFHSYCVITHASVMLLA